MAPAVRGGSHGRKLRPQGTLGPSTGGRNFRVAHPPRGRGTLRAMPDVAAHITGTVWRIECSLGDAVAEGDTVVVLESMKMEMPVESEDAGTVSAIHVAEGQAVREGEPLVTLS